LSGEALMTFLKFFSAFFRLLSVRYFTPSSNKAFGSALAQTVRASMTRLRTRSAVKIYRKTALW